MLFRSPIDRRLNQVASGPHVLEQEGIGRSRQVGPLPRLELRRLRHPAAMQDLAEYWGEGFQPRLGAERIRQQPVPAFLLQPPALCAAFATAACHYPQIFSGCGKVLETSYQAADSLATITGGTFSLVQFRRPTTAIRSAVPTNCAG